MDFFFVTENITLNFINNKNYVVVELEYLNLPTIKEQGYLLDRVYFTTSPIFTSIVKILQHKNKKEILHVINEKDQIYSSLLAHKNYKTGNLCDLEKADEYRLGIIVDFNINLKEPPNFDLLVKLLKDLNEKLSQRYTYSEINIFTVKRFDFLEMLPMVPFLNIYNIPASLDKLVQCDLYVNLSELASDNFFLNPEKLEIFLKAVFPVQNVIKKINRVPDEDLVSIIIPALNRTKNLSKSVESALNQSYKNIELIIVNDKSNEITEKVVSGYPDTPVHYVTVENKTISATRNQGALAASGKYLVYLDDDDLLIPYAIEILLRKIKTDPDQPVMVFGDVKILELDKTIKLKSVESNISDRNLFFKFIVSCFIISPGQVMIEKNAFKEVGMYDENITTAVDFELYTKIILDNNIAKINIPVLLYRVHKNRFLNSDISIMRQENDLVCQRLLNNLDLESDPYSLFEGTPEKISLQLDKLARQILSSSYFTHFYSAVKLLNIAQNKCYKEERQEFINYLEKTIPIIIKEKYEIKNRLWRQKKITVMDDPQLYNYNLHSNNVSNNNHFLNKIKYSEKLPEEETAFVKSRSGFNRTHNGSKSSSPIIDKKSREGSIIIRLTDGIGNQMFQYACGYALAKNKNKQLYYDTRYLEKNDGFTAKRYFELDIFNLTGIELMNYQLTFPETKFNGFIKETSSRYSPDIFQVDSSNLYLNGYFQSEKYFKEFEKDIKNEFLFTNALSEKNAKIKQEIGESNSISIHIRRGDYTKNDFWGLCPLSYYYQAIEFLAQKIPNPSFFVFSDEPEWAIENLKTSHNLVYISHNTGKDSFLDLQLMSLCKHNIIANSTFSWWAAWLNINQNKIVIAPKQWYGDNKMNNQVVDLISNNWLRF